MPQTNPTPNSWAIREVALATFYDTSGKALLHLPNLKTSGIENSAETVYARGGKGNAKVVGFSGNREAKVNLEDCVFTNQAIAMMTGNAIVENTAQKVYKREVLTVGTGSTVTISASPVNIATGQDFVGVFIINPDGSHKQELTQMTGTVTTGKFTVSSKTLTFFASDVTIGTTQVAVYYKATTGADVKKIRVSSDTFAGSFKLVLDCLVKDIASKQDFYAQIEIPACKMEDNWSMTMSAEGDPSTFTMPIEILKPANSTDMWTMTVYDATQLV